MIRFDGTAARVDVGNQASLQLTGAMTIMAWVESEINQNVEIISKQTSGQRGFSFQTDDDPGGDSYGMWYIATSSSTVKGGKWTNPALTNNVLRHFAVVFIPSTSMRTYTDGVFTAEETVSVPATQHDSPNNVMLGARPDASAFFQGLFEDGRIYNYAMTDEEIATIFASRGSDGFVRGRVGRWTVNESHPGATASGSNSVRDLSEFGNHGTPAGSPVYKESSLGLRRRRFF